MRATYPAHLVLLDFIILNIIWRELQIRKLLTVQFFPVSGYFHPFRRTCYPKHPYSKLIPSKELNYNTVYPFTYYTGL